MSNVHTCPRRGELPQHIVRDTDTWEQGHGLIGRQERELSCSYCGSLNPDTFMEWIRLGRQVGPTDKNYKAYIDAPESGQAKFYYQHLSDEQQIKFVEFYNDMIMQLGYPGHFYVLPFFMKKRTNG